MKDIKQEPRMFWTTIVGGVANNGSLAGNLESEWMHSPCEKTAHRLAWTGTPVSVITIALSMDGITTDATLTSADYSAWENPAGGAGDFAFEVVSAMKYRKIIVTRTSGTGTMTGLSQAVEA